MKRIVYILVLLLAACQSELLPADMIAFVENETNGLTKVQVFDAFELEATYKPIDYCVALEAKTDELGHTEYQEIKARKGDLQYIDLKIKSIENKGNAISSGLSDEAEYYDRLDYFVSHAQYDVQLIQGGDTLWPQLFHFERNYGLAPFNTILLGFENPNPSLDRTFIINDQVLGIGRVKFEFSGNVISNTPELKLN